MKRVLIIVLVISLLVIPAAADEWFSDFEQDHVDILDYSTPNGEDSFSLYYDSGEVINFPMTTRRYFSYFDILISLNTGDISSASLNGKNLTVLDCGNRLYRLYGQFARATYHSLELVLNTTANGASISFLSFDAYANHSSPVGLTGQFTWERFTNTTEQGTREQSSFRDSVSINKPAYTNAIYDSATLPWKIYATADDWNKFDFLSFVFTTDMSIDSIAVNSDLGQLPFTTNVISLGNDNSNIANKFVSVVVDVRGIPRSSTSVPTLIFSLSQDASIPGNFSLSEVLGYFDYDYEEPNVYWLRRLFYYSNEWWAYLYTQLSDLGTSIANGFNSVVTSLASNFTDLQTYLTGKFTSVSTWISNQTTSITNSLTTLRTSLSTRLDNILSAVKADTNANNQAADDFNNQVETQADELQDMSDIMNSVDRPDPEDVDIDFSQYVSQSDISGITSPLQALFSGDIFGVVLILSVMMGTVSFVFYGKR